MLTVNLFLGSASSTTNPIRRTHCSQVHFDYIYQTNSEYTNMPHIVLLDGGIEVSRPFMGEGLFQNQPPYIGF